MHNLGRWLAGKPMVDFLCAVIELFSLYITVTELWGEMCTAWLFSQGSTSLQSNSTWIGSSPTNHSWHQKTRDTRLGLPDGGDRIPLRSLVLTQYRSVTDRQTDGRICRNIIQPLQSYALHSAVKMLSNTLQHWSPVLLAVCGRPYWNSACF